jgi:hypothetical protein
MRKPSEVLGGQVKLGLAIGHEGDGGGIAIRSDASIIQRGIRLQIKDGAIKLVHRWNILRAQIEVMEPDFHADSPKNGPRTNEITSLISSSHAAERGHGSCAA